MLKRKLSNGDVWVYQDEQILKNGKRYQLGYEEGRAVYDTVGNKWLFEFEYRDHLGNLRVSFRDSLAAPVGGVYKPPVVMQVNDYDPWGVVLDQVKFVNNHNLINNFDYSNRERQSEFGLNVMALGARMFDPAIGRFWSVDPKTDQQEGLSPYHYAFNNPIRFNDPNGLIGEECCQKAIDFFAGAVLTFIDNHSPAPTPLDDGGYRGVAYETGRKAGNYLSIASGAIQAIGGAIGTLGAGVAEVTTAGLATPAAYAVGTASGAIAINGIGTILKAVTNLNAQGRNSSNESKKSNVSSGNKNSPHANQKARDAAKARYEKAKAEYEAAKSKTNKTPEEKKEADRLEKLMKHEKQKMDNTGENHSRTAKGNN